MSAAVPRTLTDVTQACELRLNPTQIRPPSEWPVKKWLHNNPLVSKVCVLALAALGIKCAIDGIRYRSVPRIAFGAVLCGAAYLVVKLLPVFIPPTHGPSHHVFAEGSCKGVTLKYHGNLPVLTIPEGVTPLDAGYARGFMFAAMIKEMRDKNNFAFQTFKGLPKDIPHLVEKMKTVIPPEYLQEMVGLVIGYNDKSATWKYLPGSDLTLDEIIYFHLLADIGSLDFEQADSWAKRQKTPSSFGCTAIVDGTVETGPVAMRTVDWFPLDIYGKYSMVEQRITSTGIHTVGQTFPLFVGGLTMMNQHGFSAAINVARGLTMYPENMPIVFYLRKMVETCTNVQEAEVFCCQKSPLGPANVTVLDPTSATSVHFYTNHDNSHCVRRWSPDNPLIVLNFQYGPQGPANDTATSSEDRLAEILRFYQRTDLPSDVEKKLEGVSQGHKVNRDRTISRAILNPKNRIFLTSFDNGYAGDRPLMAVPTGEWFQG